MTAPLLDDHLSLPETVEDLAIEALIPEFAVEGLAEPNKTRWRKDPCDRQSALMFQRILWTLIDCRTESISR